MKRTWLATLLGFVAIVAAVLVYRLWPRPVAVDVMTRESITVDDSERQYRLVIPHSLSSDPVPIVVAFHGMGGSAESMASYSELDRLAADNGFILVYPASSGSMWSTVKIDPDNLDQNADIRFFDQLLMHLASQFNLDLNRIYLIGMSNGASFAQLVAFARPNVAAVAAHSGAQPRGLRPPTRPFPILLVVGGDDPSAEALAAVAAEYRDDGHVTKFILVPGLGHEWSTNHNFAIWEFLSAHRRDADAE